MSDAPKPYAFLETIITDHKPEGWAIEFGVFSGVSLSMISQYMPVIGLDSFDGLPEDWREDYPKGMFRKPHGLPLPFTTNAMIVPGWFEDTLPRLQAVGLPDFGLVHIDCDLYSSTVTALEGVLDFIDVGTIISFDEYHGYEGYQQHEAKAWAEFVTKRGISSTVLATGEQERAFRIDSIRNELVL